MLRIQPKQSGTKQYTRVTGDRDTLYRAAAYVKAPVKVDGRGQHLDLSPRQANRVVKKFASLITWCIIYLCIIFAGVTIGEAAFGK